MKKLSWIATLVVGTVIAAPASAFPYKVKSGDTLSRLAHRFGTTVAAIQAANDLPDTMIFVDETIEIPQGTPDEPETAPSTTANPNERSYVVRSGDSLSRIAAMFDTHVQAIRDLNGMTGNLIHPGQHLRIPAPIVENDAPAGDAVTHTVAPGEWLSLIADRYDVSVEDLRLANGMAPGENMIHPGQVLTIPVAGTSGAPRDLLAVNAPAMSASDAELEVLARIVKGECPHDMPFEGQVAVAAVVLNRVRSRYFPNTIAAVAHQPMQFSSYNRDQRNRLYWGKIPAYAWQAARTALSGVDPTDNCTFYFNPYLVKPGWAKNLKFVLRIGTSRRTTHDFYRRRGVAGHPAAASPPPPVTAAADLDSLPLPTTPGLVGALAR